MKLLISQEDISKRVASLGKEISEKYKGKGITLIGVLRGGAPFCVDLMRQLDKELDVELDFISVGSYGKREESSGVVTLYKDIISNVSNRHVIIVDDIVDSGRTLSKLKKMFSERALSCEAACFLSKPARRVIDVKVEYIGYTIQDKYVVGYGLDDADKYRNLSEIYYKD